MKNYPKFTFKNLSDVVRILEYVVRERKNDVQDFNNLKDVFISGRKVAKIPTGASNVTVTDRVGDFNFDANYIYICVDNSGAEWRRVALSTW